MTSMMTLTHCLLSPNLGFSCCKMNMLTWGYISSETPKSTLVLQYLLTLATSTVVLEALGLWKFPQTTALLYKWGQKAFHSQPYVCCLYFSCDTNFLFFSISGPEAALFPINPFPWSLPGLGRRRVSPALFHTVFSTCRFMPAHWEWYSTAILPDLLVPLTLC